MPATAARSRSPCSTPTPTRRVRHRRRRSHRAAHRDARLARTIHPGRDAARQRPRRGRLRLHRLPAGRDKLRSPRGSRHRERRRSIPPNSPKSARRRPRRRSGPFDETEANPVRPYIDLGGIKILPREGLNLRLEVEEQTKRIVAGRPRLRRLDPAGAAVRRTPLQRDSGRRPASRSAARSASRAAGRGARGSARPRAARRGARRRRRRRRGQAARALHRRRRTALVPARRDRRAGRRPTSTPPRRSRICSARSSSCAADRRCRLATSSRCGCRPPRGDDRVTDEPSVPTSTGRPRADERSEPQHPPRADCLGARRQLAAAAAQAVSARRPATRSRPGTSSGRPMGGWRGILESVLPSLVFLVSTSLHDSPAGPRLRCLALAASRSGSRSSSRSSGWSTKSPPTRRSADSSPRRRGGARAVDRAAAGQLRARASSRTPRTAGVPHLGARRLAAASASPSASSWARAPAGAGQAQARGAFFWLRSLGRPVRRPARRAAPALLRRTTSTALGTTQAHHGPAAVRAARRGDLARRAGALSAVGARSRSDTFILTSR